MDDEDGLGFIWILGIIIGVILVIGFFMSWSQVPAGAVGVKDSFGVISPEPLQPGLYFVGPFVSVHDITTRIQKHTTDEVGISKDSQEVKTQVTVNYRVNGADTPQMYKDLGSEFFETVASPIVTGIIKTELAKYSADTYSSNWQNMTQEIQHTIITRLGEYNIKVTEVSITDFDFAQAFNDAIEAKAVSEQLALKALNDKKTAITMSEATAQSTKNAADATNYATKANADAQAYALRVVREQLEQSNQLIQYKTIEKWNGALPTVQTSGSDTLLNIPMVK